MLENTELEPAVPLAELTPKTPPVPPPPTVTVTGAETENEVAVLYPPAPPPPPCCVPPPPPPAITKYSVVRVTLGVKVPSLLKVWTKLDLLESNVIVPPVANG
jgi:hypothetical protein